MPSPCGAGDGGHPSHPEAVRAGEEHIDSSVNDLVVQRLFAAGLALQGIASLTEDPRVADRLRGVADELAATISDIRTAIFALTTSPRRAPDGLRSKVLGPLADRVADRGERRRSRRSVS
jgi:two-component system sensor histidine kinase DevS